MKFKISTEKAQLLESIVISSMCGAVMLLGIEFVMTF